MIAHNEIRERLVRTIQQSQRVAVGRRTRAEEAERDTKTVLTQVVTPVFKTIASILKDEGYSFRVLTPTGAVQLASEASSEDFIELMLDTKRDPPALVGRVSRGWGRRVLVNELVLRVAPVIGDLTEDEVLEFALAQLGPFVER